MTSSRTVRAAIRHPLVVVPTYDEADNIVGLLERIRASTPEADVLVVDDSSPDGTGSLVTHLATTDTAVHLLTRTTKAGLGAAYRSGFEWALRRGYDAIVQIDADLSHPPDRIPALLAALQHADVAVGSRYVEGGDVTGWAQSRRTVSWAGNLYARTVLGLPVRDVTAGFKAFRRSALIDCGALQSRSDGYCFQIENSWRAVQAGLVTTEVPITFTDRTRGTSKMSSAIAAEAMWRVTGWRIGEILGLASARPGGTVEHRRPDVVM